MKKRWIRTTEVHSLRRWASVALGATLFATPVQVQGQNERGIVEVLDLVAENLDLRLGPIIQDPTTRSVFLDSIKVELIKKLRDPNTLNAALRHLEEQPFLNGLLKELNLSFANVQTEDGESLLGLSYDWSRDFVYDSNMSDPGGANVRGFRATLEAEGTATQVASSNPRDFLDSEVSISAFGSWGGTMEGDTLFGRLNALADSLTGFTSLAELEASPQFAEFFGEIWGRLSTQYYVTLALSGGLETDQTFDTRQQVIEGSLGVDVKAWRPGSALAMLNVFDWPAAMLRYLVGAESAFSPSGVAIPTAVLAVGRVDPTANTFREGLGETDPYYRLGVEVAYRSPIVPTAGGQIYLEGSVRHYRELDAPAAVEAAGLDAFTLFSLSLTAPSGLYVAYSEGQLPFDLRDTRVYEIGLNWKF